MSTTRHLLISLLVLYGIAECINAKAQLDGPDESAAPLVQTRITDLGEEETHVSVKGVSAIETSAPGEGERFLYVREALKNGRLVWLVYKHTQIVDCNVTTYEPDVKKFRNKFHSFENNRGQGQQQQTPAAEVSELADYRALLKTCRLFKKEIRAMRIERHQLEKSHGKHRSKRFSMIYPGTNWCGRGDQAAGGYDDLGENFATDRCCREHDHCPYTISRFSTDFNYWNYRLHTISHCSCEERFKACLKSAGNSVANMVGYIYFGYVGTECFTLVPEQTCMERSWWGKCNKYDTEYNAEVADSNITF